MDDRNAQALGDLGNGEAARPGADPAAESTLIIRDAGDLRMLRGSRRLYTEQPLAILFPQLSPGEAEGLSERLNRARSECGCSVGAKCMAATALGVLAWLAAQHGFFTAAFLWRLPLAFLWAMVGAGAGKAFGIFAARWRLRRELDLLLINMSHFS